MLINKLFWRYEEIWKIFPKPPVSPEDPNQAQLQLENSGDINPISPDISPAANSQNHAQNSSSGDTGYTGDILHTTSSENQENDHSKSIYRLGHSDTFACEYCNLKGDIWFMRQHICNGQK